MVNICGQFMDDEIAIVNKVKVIDVKVYYYGFYYYDFCYHTYKEYYTS